MNILNSNSYIVVIPARYHSKRLPGKPLKNIQGKPMIVRTYNQCRKVVPKKNIIIATDSKKILNVCKKNNIQSILTSSNCLTGTDRVYEVSKIIKKKIYINLQGDEPLFSPKDIKKFLKIALKDKSKIYNGYCKINNKEDFFNKSIPKVVFNNRKELLYMSRSPIPGNKMGILKKAFRQICIYSFPFFFLQKFGKAKKKSFLENFEDIEILRFLETGNIVKMVPLSSSSISVDTQKDLKKVNLILKKKKL